MIMFRRFREQIQIWPPRAGADTRQRHTRLAVVTRLIARITLFLGPLSIVLLLLFSTIWSALIGFLIAAGLHRVFSFIAASIEVPDAQR